MRVCLITEARSLHSVKWAATLARAGMEAHVVTAEPADIPGVQVHAMPLYHPASWRQALCLFRARKAIRAIAPDVLHLFGLFAVSSPGAMLIPAGFRPLIVQSWGSDIIPPNDTETAKERFIKRFLLGQGTRLVAISTDHAKKMARYAPRGKDVEVVYLGVDTALFHPPASRPGRETVHVGFAKRLHGLAAPDTALEAFIAALRDHGAPLHLHIAGDGPMREELMERALQAGVSGRVTWEGWVSGPEALLGFYHGLDIFFMPSRKESLGTSSLEAMATGLPLVASDAGGIPDTVEHGVTGLLCAPGDVSGFARALARLAENPEERRAMGREGRRLAEERFDLEKNAADMIALYRDALGG